MLKHPSVSLIPEAIRSSFSTSLSKILMVEPETGVSDSASVSFPLNVTVEPTVTLLGGGFKVRAVLMGLATAGLASFAFPYIPWGGLS